MHLLKWELTHKCNLRCSHCIIGKTLEHTEDTEINTTEALSLITEAASLGVKRISFLGGEPLIRKDICELIYHATALGIDVSVVSNGTLLSKELFSSLTNAGLAELTVSLDAPCSEINAITRGHSSFIRVIRNLSEASRIAQKHPSKLKLCINTVLHQDNSDRKIFGAFADLFNNLHVNTWRLLPLQVDDLVAESALSAIRSLSAHGYLEVARLLAEIRPNIPKHTLIDAQFIGPLAWGFLSMQGLDLPFPWLCCDAGSDMLFIEPDGSISGCDRIRQLSYAKNKFLDSSKWNKEGDLKAYLLSTTNADLYGQIKYFFNTTSYTPCKTCHYLTQRLCEPCALYSLGGVLAPYSTCTLAAELLTKSKVKYSCNMPTPEGGGRRSIRRKIHQELLPKNISEIALSNSNNIFSLVGERGYLFVVDSGCHLELTDLPLAIYLLIDGERNASDILRILLPITKSYASQDSIMQIIFGLMEAGAVITNDIPYQKTPNHRINSD